MNGTHLPYRHIEITTRISGLSKPVLSIHDMKFIKTNRYQARTVNIKVHESSGFIAVITGSLKTIYDGDI